MEPSVKLWGACVLSAMLIIGPTAHAQHEELQQNLAAFEEYLAADYEKKTLNVTEPSWGALNDSEPDWHEFFQLKAKEKREDNLGRNGYRKIDVALYAWHREEDGNWALKTWMERFLEDRKIRPGRTIRIYEYGKPTVIIMDTSFVVIAQMDCSDYFDDEFKDWVKTVERFFSSGKAMTLELRCEGPLEWTKNAPDPKAKKKR